MMKNGIRCKNGSIQCGCCRCCFMNAVDLLYWDSPFNSSKSCWAVTASVM